MAVKTSTPDLVPVKRVKIAQKLGRRREMVVRWEKNTTQPAKRRVSGAGGWTKEAVRNARN